MFVKMDDLRSHQCEENRRTAEFDARGIFLTYACEVCRKAKLSRYRPEVLTDPNYDTYGERIEEEDE